MRLVDLLAGLSRLADLGFGIPAGEAVRAAALTTAMGRSLQLPDADVSAAMYTALLHHVGCTGYAHEAAAIVGDELTMYAVTAQTNLADPRELFTTLLPGMTRGQPPLQRARMTLATLTRGQRIAVESTTAACEVGRDAARRLGLAEQVQDSLYHSYEWWNGKGVPDGLAGDAIPVGSRLAALASTAALLATTADRARLLDVVRGGSGALFDPAIADHFVEHAEGLLAEVDTRDPLKVLLEAEPPPVVTVPDPYLAAVATVFGDLADLKTPWTHGHSRGVARLARDAGEQLGMADGDLDELYIAALLHDVGRVAISSAVWDKAGPLSTHEWEQVRLHAYHSERILAGSEQLTSLARLVGTHHERGDGTGYHRACTHHELPLPARLLAAADAYHAMTEPRPHRQALGAGQAESELLAENQRGRLDPDAVGAVLAAAGHTTTVRSRPPAGLTDREVEVLGVLAHGCSNKEIARRLVISRRTAEHHVQSIYAKIGVSSRAAAAMFAMEHGLLTVVDRGG